MLPETLELNGLTCRLHIRRTARKNIIVRAPHRDVLQLNIPPRMSERVLTAWLKQQHDLLESLAARAATLAHEVERLPETVYYLGQAIVLQQHAMVLPDQTLFRLPEHQDAAIQKQAVADFLYRRAQVELLPRLQAASERSGLVPAAVRLTRAKSFWGVCRGQRIALNWRLIGAPAAVIDYVCAHELCHLREAHHGRAFWQLLSEHCDEVDFARKWLKQHRMQLFQWG
ncbi:MAG: SprT family zinc-dependent metalloprotease [Neisseria sp.]|nr:SprT family zinc-dependent metalloprotease [Neisseria sp.]